MDDVEGPGAEELFIAPVDGPMATRLADLESTVRDLEFVVDCCARLQELQSLPADDSDNVTIEAVWSAALVAYSRCFATGRRLGLDEKTVLQDLSSNAREAHTFMRQMRDKHVAHSVNPFEQVKVGVVLAPPGESPSILGSVVLRANYLSQQGPGVEALRILGSWLRERVAELIDAGRDATIEEANELPLADLYARGRLEVVLPRHGDATRPR